MPLTTCTKALRANTCTVGGRWQGVHQKPVGGKYNTLARLQLGARADCLWRKKAAMRQGTGVAHQMDAARLAQSCPQRHYRDRCLLAAMLDLKVEAQACSTGALLVMRSSPLQLLKSGSVRKDNSTAPAQVNSCWRSAVWRGHHTR